MAKSFEITGRIVKEQNKMGDTILLNIPMKPGDTLQINGWEVTLPDVKK